MLGDAINTRIRHLSLIGGLPVFLDCWSDRTTERSLGVAAARTEALFEEKAAPKGVGGQWCGMVCAIECTRTFVLKQWRTRISASGAEKGGREARRVGGNGSH